MVTVKQLNLEDGWVNGKIKWVEEKSDYLPSSIIVRNAESFGI